MRTIRRQLAVTALLVSLVQAFTLAVGPAALCCRLVSDVDESAAGAGPSCHLEDPSSTRYADPPARSARAVPAAADGMEGETCEMRGSCTPDDDMLSFLLLTGELSPVPAHDAVLRLVADLIGSADDPRPADAAPPSPPPRL